MPRLTGCDHADPAALDAAMAVMERGFDAMFGEAWNRGQLAGMLELPGSWLTVAWIDDAPAGFTLLRAIFDEAELLLIAVDPGHRRRGLGRQLLQKAMLDARSRGVTQMHLEVRAGNGAASLYSQSGFVQANRRKDYYRGSDGQIFDALTFSRRL